MHQNFSSFIFKLRISKGSSQSEETYSSRTQLCLEKYELRAKGLTRSRRRQPRSERVSGARDRRRERREQSRTISSKLTCSTRQIMTSDELQNDAA